MELFGYRFSIQKIDWQSERKNKARQDAEEKIFDLQLNLAQLKLLNERAEAHGHDEDYIKKHENGIEQYTKQIEAYQATLDVLNNL